LKQSDWIISTDAPPDEGGDLAPQGESRRLTVDASLHGLRLDKALAEMVPELSRSYLQQLVETEAVRVQGELLTKVAAKVRAGQVIDIELRPTLQSKAFKPEAMALDVVHEDEHVCVIHKPAGMVVHPAPGNWSGTLLNGLLARDSQAHFLPRAGIVHRLDKDTSGLMVVARTRMAMDALVQMIGERQVGRQYLALAHRPWLGERQRRAEWPIGRDPGNRLRMAAVDLSQHPGKTATTDIELLTNASQGCWVRCTLHTGRTHQIRVHMMMLGHPLVGDALYGGAAAAGLSRQALHAYRLTFSHPVTQQLLVFEAGPPPDLMDALDAWGLSYNP
jgi:23S rRNA pseudouridine1911/1915/1917 synthase